MAMGGEGGGRPSAVCCAFFTFSSLLPLLLPLLFSNPLFLSESPSHSHQETFVLVVDLRCRKESMMSDIRSVVAFAVSSTFLLLLVAMFFFLPALRLDMAKHV